MTNDIEAVRQAADVTAVRGAWPVTWRRYTMSPAESTKACWSAAGCSAADGHEYILHYIEIRRLGFSVGVF